MLFQRQMGVAFVEESVFANQIGLGETFFNIAKFQRDLLVDVAAVAVFVNARLLDQQRFINGRDRGQALIFDFDEIHRVEGRVFIDSGHGRDRVANETDLVDT